MEGRLNKLLAEQYEKHYCRVNVTMDIINQTKRLKTYMELMYGSFVDSLPEGSRILDLGCGTGFLLYWLSRRPNIIPYGVDISPSQTKILKQSMPNVNISCEDGLEYLKKNVNTFAGIFCIDVLEHIESDDLCLEWIEAVLNALLPGGFFYCRGPNAANLTGGYSRYMDLTHKRIFTDLSLLQLLEAGGLEDCRIVSVRASRLTGKTRLCIEALMHRLVYLICGRPLERVFTINVSAVGFKKLHVNSQ